MCILLGKMRRATWIVLAESSAAEKFLLSNNMAKPLAASHAV